MHRGSTRATSIGTRLVAIIALPLAVYALYATGQKAVDSYHLSQRADAIRAEVRALQDENLRLQREIERSRGDAEVERMAREHLGLIMPGDRALVVLGPTPEPTALAPRRPNQAPAASVEPATTPMWRQWWNFFFGLAPSTQ